MFEHTINETRRPIPSAGERGEGPARLMLRVSQTIAPGSFLCSTGTAQPSRGYESGIARDRDRDKF
jgi:hypothetical protein